jgi:hypothetical protein
LHRRGDGARGVDQRGIFANQPPLPPIHFQQEGQQRLLDRDFAGDPDDRAPAGVQRRLEAQRRDRALRRLQPNATEGLRRCELHLQALQFARVAGDDRDFGDQRLSGLRFDLDLAKSQRGRRARRKGQRERHRSRKG